MRQYYFHDARVLDLEKFRAEANKISSVGRWGEDPEDVTIHHHDIKQSCEGHDHETFLRGNAGNESPKIHRGLR